MSVQPYSMTKEITKSIKGGFEGLTVERMLSTGCLTLRLVGSKGMVKASAYVTGSNLEKLMEEVLEGVVQVHAWTADRPETCSPKTRREESEALAQKLENYAMRLRTLEANHVPHGGVNGSCSRCGYVFQSPEDWCQIHGETPSELGDSFEKATAKALSRWPTEE